MASLAPAVLEQLARLGATLDAAPPPVSEALPSSFTDLRAVRWPPESGPYPYTHRGYREDLGLGVSTDGLRARGHEGPVYSIAEDRVQFYYVIRGDDDSTDPLVFRVDHDGSSELASGTPLSQFLAALHPVPRVSDLLKAMRDLGPEAAIASIRADPDTAKKPFDKKPGFQPIHLAVLQRQPEVVAALLEVGVPPGAPLRASMKLPRKYLGDGSWQMLKPGLEAGETPLHLAVRESPKTARWLGPEDVAIVKQLLAAGADPNAADVAGHTPLQLLAGASVVGSANELMKTLIDAGAKPDVFGADTPSPLVLSFRPPERAKMLLEAGASPNTPTCYFTGTVSGGPNRKLHGTAVHAAAARDEDAILKLMLDSYGGLPDVVAPDGSKPLDNAYGASGFLLRTRLAAKR